MAAKIQIHQPQIEENFKLFCCTLVALSSVNLNDFTVHVVRVCVMASPKMSADHAQNSQITEPTAHFSCHIIQYMFTSSPKPLSYRPSSYVQRLLASNARLLSFNTFLLVLKGLFLLSTFHVGANSNANRPEPVKKESSSSKMKQTKSSTENLMRANSVSEESGQLFDLCQLASVVLQEICAQDWIKERCLKEGDNLLAPNHLCEAALGKGPQKLWRIICYPENHQLRNINDQVMSTKDVIRNILQNLDIWSLRESLLELKLMIEMQKSKDSPYVCIFESL